MELFLPKLWLKSKEKKELIKYRSTIKPLIGNGVKVSIKETKILFLINGRLSSEVYLTHLCP
ncbi:hypothetical protein TUM4438_43510 [Shewanella sairae]|uniref:Uncharacterized protein n=1 Tax=Shewanella sairae TaxID=190310 RepID=A0ABQ4PR96_9GAMM|nr:hypothetical protein TUM4438_43510 [Shewanella sairae]